MSNGIRHIADIITSDPDVFNEAPQAQQAQAAAPEAQQAQAAAPQAQQAQPAQAAAPEAPKEGTPE